MLARVVAGGFVQRTGRAVLPAQHAAADVAAGRGRHALLLPASDPLLIPERASPGLLLIDGPGSISLISCHRVAVALLPCRSLRCPRHLQ